MAQESSQYHPRLQTYAVIKNSLLILILLIMKNSPNKKGYIGFVGSQPMLLLFDACLNIWCKSNNIGCDPTNPMYPFLFGEFFY